MTVTPRAPSPSPSPVVLVALLAVAACGGGGDGGPNVPEGCEDGACRCDLDPSIKARSVHGMIVPNRWIRGLPQAAGPGNYPAVLRKNQPGRAAA